MSTQTSGAHNPSFYLPTLDGFRALSIAIVFVAHAGLMHVVPGGFGVTVFFFLSGFLISTLLRREFERSGTISFKNFYLRRVLRIFPCFYVALLLSVVLYAAGLLPGAVDPQGVGLLAAHLGNYTQIFLPQVRIPAGTGVFWSLAVEEHYYATFPLLAWLLLRRNDRRLTLVTLIGIAVIILAWRIHLVGSGAIVDRTYLATDTRLDSILWGCLLGLVFNPALDARPRVSTGAKATILATSLAVLMACFLLRDDAFRQTYRYTLQGVALLPIFYFAVADADSPLFRWLDWKPLRYIGTLSYVLYLVHHTVLYSLWYLRPSASPMLRGVAAAGVSVALAALSQRYLERPIAELRSRLR